jgi:hypothetical protein
MSIIQHSEKESVDGLKQVEAVLMRAPTNKKGEIEAEISPYMPAQEVIDVRAMILKHFVLGSSNMYTPKVEFNDLSLVLRDQYDQMSFNTYQPNNGDGWNTTPQTSWRSNAIRPIVRNKCMSIAAHANARLIFPKIFAYNEDADEQQDAAEIIEDLMEWSGDISQYPYTALMRVITAMASPASIGYTEYAEVMRNVKVEKGDDGKWITKRQRDEAYPLFSDYVVPVTQFYIENMYEPDVQKQGFVIWRKVYGYSEAQIKYGDNENFQYVHPGVQTLYDDANRNFYYVYDPNMRSYDVEEVMYWNKGLDLKIILVNGVMMTEHDNPNPRNDKLYPFDKFFYEPINERFFYGKSLANKLQQDADVINTLYQMVIDGTYLSIFKPMVNVGGEIIASDVIVPGAVTTFSDPNSDLRAINVGADLKDGLATLSEVEQSINDSSDGSLAQNPQQPNQDTTAYQISVMQQNANTTLGNFIQMISKHVVDFGKLRLGDILQYITLPDITKIDADSELTYKTIFMKGDSKEGGNNKKLSFDTNIPDDMSEEEKLDASYEILDEENQKKMSITKANPIFIRELQYMVSVNPDVLQPRSTDLERSYGLESYDRMVMHPEIFDPEETGKLLLSNTPNTKKDIEKYITKKAPQGQNPQQPNPMQPNQPAQNAMPNANNSPLKSAMGKSPLGMNNVPAPMQTLGQ